MRNLTPSREPKINRFSARVIPVARPSIGPEEGIAVADCLARGQLAGGAAVEEFERQMAAKHACNFGVACNSGTTALVLALRGVGVKPGDKVLIPSLTMVAVANAVLDVGGIPLFGDSELLDGNLSEKWLTIHPDIDAVIVPHLYGVIAECFMEAVSHYADRIKVVEDWAECHFSRRPLSTIDRISYAKTFSFYGNKIITTGEGGMVLTDLEFIRDKLASLRAHAFSKDYHFNHTDHAYGYRMTELQGAIGLTQLRKAHDFLRKRLHIAKWYEDRLRDVAWLEMPYHPSGNSWWVFPLLVKPDSKVSRDKVRESLAENGIETRTYFCPLHRQVHLRKYATHDMPVADDLFSRGFYLPMYVDMTEDDVEYICDAIARI